MTIDPAPPVGILGGTGKLGAGLALRWAAAGVPVTIGSRDPDRAETIAAELREELPAGAGSLLVGRSNQMAATRPIVVAAIPTEGSEALIRGLADELAGGILVSALSPLTFDAGQPRPAGVTGAESAAELLAAAAPDATVVAGFHTVAAGSLRRLAEPLDEDVLLCGDAESVARVAPLIDDLLPGARAINCGPLHLAATLEALTAVLISINKLHRTHAGVRLTGL